VVDSGREGGLLNISKNKDEGRRRGKKKDKGIIRDFVRKGQFREGKRGRRDLGGKRKGRGRHLNKEWKKETGERGEWKSRQREKTMILQKNNSEGVTVRKKRREGGAGGWGGEA